MSNIIQQLEAEQMTREVPAFYPGDTVVVQVRVKEGDRERLQAFEGVVIAKRNRGLHSAFTVRKISHGEGVERAGVAERTGERAGAVFDRGGCRQTRVGVEQRDHNRHICSADRIRQQHAHQHGYPPAFRHPVEHEQRQQQGEQGAESHDHPPGLQPALRPDGSLRPVGAVRHEIRGPPDPWGSAHSPLPCGNRSHPRSRR